MASLEYINAEPDPLRDFAEKIVDEMNSMHPEDVQRLYSVYVEPGFQVWFHKYALVFSPSFFLIGWMMLCIQISLHLSWKSLTMANCCQL